MSECWIIVYIEYTQSENILHKFHLAIIYYLPKNRKIAIHTTHELIALIYV